MDKLTWPAWFNGPNGQTAIFEAPEDVPNGWTSGAEKLSVKGASKPSPAPKEPAKEPAKAPAADGEVDASGAPFDPALHAATKSKTKAGLWRLKVGVKRPEAKPPLDL